MRNFLAASLLATEAFLAASNLSCLLLSNKSILNLLVFMILLFFCKDYASECNESLLSICRAQLILCKITLFFRKMQAFFLRKCLRVSEINRKSKGITTLMNLLLYQLRLALMVGWDVIFAASWEVFR